MKQTHIILYPMNCEVTGVASLVLSLGEKKVIGFNFLSELDTGMVMSQHPATLAIVKAVANMVKEITGTCIVRPSAKGWHFISLNIIPYDQFKQLAIHCEIIQSMFQQDHRYLVLRITRKADEHCMPLVYTLYQKETEYPISAWHKRLWEKILDTKLYTGQKEVLASGMLVTYRC